MFALKLRKIYSDEDATFRAGGKNGSGKCNPSLPVRILSVNNVRSGQRLIQRGFPYQTDRPLESLVDSAIFRPLGISDAAFTWAALAETIRFAYRFDVTGGEQYDRYRIKNVSAAGSMTISVGDYLKFALSVLRADGLSPVVVKVRDPTPLRYSLP